MLKRINRNDEKQFKKPERECETGN